MGWITYIIIGLLVIGAYQYSQKDPEGFMDTTETAKKAVQSVFQKINLTEVNWSSDKKTQQEEQTTQTEDTQSTSTYTESQLTTVIYGKPKNITITPYDCEVDSQCQTITGCDDECMCNLTLGSCYKLI